MDWLFIILMLIILPGAIGVRQHCRVFGRPKTNEEAVGLFIIYGFGNFMLSVSVKYARGWGGRTVIKAFSSVSNILKYGLIELAVSILVPYLLYYFVPVIRKRLTGMDWLAFEAKFRNIDQKMIRRAAAVAAALAVIALGVLCCNDYGLFVDAPAERTESLMAYKHLFPSCADIKTLSVDFSKIPNELSSYGVAMQMPMVYLEALTGFMLPLSAVYHLRHLYTYLIFAASAFAFASFLYGVFKNKYVAAVGTCFYVLNPLIFAMSFVNIKDSVFMSLFTIGIFCFYKVTTLEERLNKRSLLILLGSAFITALAINSRVIGGLLGIGIGLYLLVRFLLGRGKRKILFAHGIIYAASSLLFYTAITPSAWSGLFAQLFHTIQVFSNYTRYKNAVFYMGQLINCANMPWHYVPVMILLTSPNSYIVCFLIGIVLSVLKAVKKNLSEKEASFCVFCGGVIIFTFSYIWIKKPVLYSEWRHFYYLHPCFIFFVSVTLSKAASIRKRALKMLVCTLLLLGPVLTGRWMIQNHPYEYMYYNILAREAVPENFDRDRCRISYEEAVRYVLSIDNRKTVKIMKVRLGRTQGLTVAERERVRFVSDKEKADYIIELYTNAKQSTRDNENKQYKKIFDRKVDGMSVYTIFRTK